MTSQFHTKNVIQLLKYPWKLHYRVILRPYGWLLKITLKDPAIHLEWLSVIIRAFFASPLWKATEEWSRGDIFVKGVPFETKVTRLRIQEGQPFWEAVRIDLTAKSLQRVSLVGFPSGSGVKNLPAMQEMWVWSLGQEDSPGGENGNPLQYSYLENPTDKEASQAPRGHKESDMAERLHTHIFCYLSLPLTRILTLQVKFLFFRE